MNNEDKYFNEEDLIKISFGKFIEEVFARYSHLYILTFNYYCSHFIKAGKVQEHSFSLKINPTLQYNDSYYHWFDRGARVYNDKQDLQHGQHKEKYSINIFNQIAPIDFYFQYESEKMSYEEFQEKILVTPALTKENINTIFNKINQLMFCRDSLQQDINAFLGQAILRKRHAQLLNESLGTNMVLHKVVKI